MRYGGKIICLILLLTTISTRIVAQRFNRQDMTFGGKNFYSFALNTNPYRKSNGYMTYDVEVGFQTIPSDSCAYVRSDTRKQLLARSRHLLFKSPEKWSKSQKIRTAILFEEYPDIKDAYSLVHRLRMIYAHTKTTGGALPKLALWYNDVQKTNFKEFKTVAETIQTHYSNILNFFNNRSTNASAESLNSKIKAFRMQLRGVSDVKYFLFRLTKIYA